MDWLQLPTIDGGDKTAANLRKQVADLEAFRTAALSPTPPVGQFYAGEEAVNEALRREYLLRIDIERYLKSAGQDTSAISSTVAQVRQILDERGGHRTANHGR